MASEFTLPLAYEQADVVSAQRLRFRHSRRLWLLASLSLVALIILALQQINPALVRADAPMSWGAVAGMAALFVLAPVLFYVLVPALDYRNNQAWRQHYTLRVDKKRLRLARAGAERGFELAWPAVLRLLENERVFLVFFGAKPEMVMIPKRTFASPEQVDTFRRFATPEKKR